MVKKLRYYARFIVVCLLLKKMKLVRELVIELERQIQEYTSTYVVIVAKASGNEFSTELNFTTLPLSLSL